ncbi:MAG: hypothetical protein ABFC89_08810 [Methanospirillum sp.]
MQRSLTATWAWWGQWQSGRPNRPDAMIVSPSTIAIQPLRGATRRDEAGLMECLTRWRLRTR